MSPTNEKAYCVYLLTAWDKSESRDLEAAQTIMRAAVKFGLDPREVYDAAALQVADRAAFPSYEEIGPPGT